MGFVALNESEADIKGRFVPVEDEDIKAEASNTKYDPNTDPVSYIVNEVKKSFTGIGTVLGAPLAFQMKQFAPFVAAIAQREFPEASFQKNMDLVRRSLEELAGVKKMKPTSPAVELAGDIAQFATPGIPIAGGMIAKAPNLAMKGSIAATELLSSLGGGIGTNIGRDVGGETGAAVGGLAGGITPSLLFPSLRAGATSLMSAATDYAGSAGKRISEILANKPRSTQEISRSNRIVAEVEQAGGAGFSPSLSARSGSTAMRSLEEGLIGSSGAKLEEAISRMNSDITALERVRVGAFGHGQRGDVVSDVVRARLAADTKVTEQLLDSLRKRREQISAQAAGIGEQRAGVILEKSYADELRAARAIRDGKYEDVYAVADKMGKKSISDMSDVVAELKEIRAADENVFQKLPPIFKQALARYGGKESELTGRSISPDLMAVAGITAKPEASFRELHSLWKQVNSETSALLNAGDVSTARYAGLVKDMLERKLKVFSEGGFGELTDSFNAANTWFKTKYAPAFKEGIGGKMGAPTRFGDRIRDDDLVGKFFTPSGVDDFNAIYQSNPKAREALSNAVLGMFSRDANTLKNGGVFAEKAGISFYQKHKETLDKLPDVRDRLLDASRRSDALAEAGEVAIANLKAADQSILGRIAKGGEAQIVKALVDGDFAGIARVASIPSTRPALARTIAENISAAAQAKDMTALQYLTAHGTELKPIMDSLGSGHFKNLAVLARAEDLMRRSARLPESIEMEKVLDPLKQAIGTSRSELTTMIRSAKVTRASSEFWIAQNTLFRYLNKIREDKVGEVTWKAIHDPAFAESLAKGLRLRSSTLMREIEANGLRLGIRIVGSQEAEE